jgi:hypothetical protein
VPLPVPIATKERSRTTLVKYNVKIVLQVFLPKTLDKKIVQNARKGGTRISWVKLNAKHAHPAKNKTKHNK